ncbi:MAG: M20/M25/M40 family metallo-hydrolase [Polyangiaceae bacterium]|nr:M20/M25/M40 family metallo-hydrolase [Polyangiaceae bacterium]
MDDGLDRFDAARAMRDLRELCDPVMAGRLPGTEGERRAADYLEAQLGAAGIGVTRDAFEVVVPVLAESPGLSVAGTRLVHLEDFCVNVQGAAAGGRAEAEAVWLDRAQTLPATLEGRIGVCRVDAAGGRRTGLDAYVDRHRRIRDAGAVGMIQVGPRTDRRKVMNHRRERPGLPSVDASPSVVELAFGRGRPVVGQVGRRVALAVPLEDRQLMSAGNLIAPIGTGPVRVVLCAHYDHVGAIGEGVFFAGASDNASGVAVVLEVARVLAARPTGPGTVVILFTAAEEVGMLGARRFASRVRRDVTVVNLDEVAGEGEDPIWLLASRGFPEGLVEARDFVRIGAPLRTVPMAMPAFDDSVPFVEHGVEKVATLFRRAAGPEVAHTLGDVPERISPSALTPPGRALLLLAARARGGEAPPQTE